MKNFFDKHLYLIFLIIGGLLVCDTLVLLIKTASRSLGIFMPICLGLPLVVAGILEKCRPSWLKNAFGKIVRWLYVIAYAAFLLLFTTTTVLCISAASAKAPESCDVMIILGCGVKGTRPTLTLTKRLDRAIIYLNENPSTLVIVSGGKGPSEAITEAEAMRIYLTEHGIDESRIFEEDKSTSTTENFAFSKRIIDEKLPQGARVCFGTTNFHVYRAGKVAQKQGIKAYGIGASGVWYITLNDYLRECVGITLYTLTGKA